MPEPEDQEFRHSPRDQEFSRTLLLARDINPTRLYALGFGELQG